MLDCETSHFNSIFIVDVSCHKNTDLYFYVLRAISSACLNNMQ